VGLLKSFNEAFPTVPIRIFVESMGAAAEKVLDRTCSIGITGPLVSDIDELLRVPIGTSEHVLVAAPNHPLGSWLGEIPFDILGEFVQLVLTDRSALTRGKDFGVLSPLTWRLSDLGAKHAMILAGLGWGALPHYMAEADLREKRLVQLRIAGFENTFWSTPMPLYAVHRVDTAPGPAARWMLDRLKTLMDDEVSIDKLAVAKPHKVELAARQGR
jgi:DNA-binding transcriptional LysR family regulator